MRTLVFALLVAGCGAPELDGDSNDAESFGIESACTPGATATFTVGANAIGPAFVGYGAQYNQNLWATISADAGITPARIAALEPRLTALSPEHVRIFFDSRAYGDADLMRSFVRTVELAERSGATVNVTYWHGPYRDPKSEMHRFAQLLHELVVVRGLGAVSAVTIQNEVNSTKITMPQYEGLYRHLDGELRALGLRKHVALVGGDLLRESQGAWIDYLGHHMADLLDGYSVHIYWDYRDTAKLVSRLTEVRALVDALPAAARKPLYVTEFGVRGIRGVGEAEPGHLLDGQQAESSIASALQQGWFDLLAARLGYVATVRWDAYFALYDRAPQEFSLVADEQGTWRERPGYPLLRMLTHVVQPGWRAHAVSGSSSGKLVTAFRGEGQTTVLLLNNTACPQTVRLRGLPSGALYHIVWNGDGRGELSAKPRVHVLSDGAAPIALPPRSVTALATQLPGLGL